MKMEPIVKIKIFIVIILIDKTRLKGIHDCRKHYVSLKSADVTSKAEH